MRTRGHINFEFFKLTYFTGDGIDFWNRKKWQDEISKYQLLVMVHDVFKRALDHGYFHMERVNLIIVDECHHSFGNSSFNQIFKNHYHPLKERYPGKIFSLDVKMVDLNRTATPATT